MSHSADEKSEEFQELQSEVDKLKDSLKSERSKNADADRKKRVYFVYNGPPPKKTVLKYRVLSINDNISVCIVPAESVNEITPQVIVNQDIK